MKIKAAIIGATGYTGFELIRLLSSHPNVKIVSIISRKKENFSLQDIYPSFNTIEKLYFENLDFCNLTQKVDIIFSALPHKASMEVVSKFIDKGIKVVDLSADFRFQNVLIYEQWYCEHISKDLNQQAVYGLPEIYGEQIKNAQLIANPGCYPTSAILGVYPVLKEKIKINPNIIIDSKSGVTGAGRNPSLKTLFSEVNDNFSAYSINSHRHEPEIEEKLSLIYEKPINVTFTPHLLPINRGILSTIYLEINDEKITYDDIYNLYLTYYKNKFFIKILPQNQFPSTAMVKASNFCFIGISYNKNKKRLTIISVIDNIGKGASAQAIQNMNLMFNLPEETGLTYIPTYL